jgi:hypothetical protein
MSELMAGKLNWLERNLPEGLLVDASWLAKHSYSTALRRRYVKSGWLQQPTRQVYTRSRGPLSWQQVVISLQNLLQLPLVVGGRTALELHGVTHYLSQQTLEVHLYGAKAPPGWLKNLPIEVEFRYHNTRKLFRNEPVTIGLGNLDWDVAKQQISNDDAASLELQPWGQSNWPLTLSSPERAVLELLAELPDHESFHQVDKLMEGMGRLRPKRLQKLLVDCKSVKVKRLFFFFADRHHHAWLKYLEKDKVDLGKGKRMLSKGGKFDPVYQITVPEDLDGVL